MLKFEVKNGVCTLYLLLRDNFEIRKWVLSLTQQGFEHDLTDRKKARKLMGI